MDNPYYVQLHNAMAYIRIKSDSLYGAILPHWVSDFAYRIVIHI